MKKKVYLVLKIVFLLLLIASLVVLLSWYNDKRVVDKIQEESKVLIEEVKTEEGIVKYKVKEEAVSKNEDTVGWIKVEGTKIDYPVVQAKDNKYYLNHNYLKKRSSAGWIFMDSNNSLTDENIIIYGHHRKDGIMFGHIDRLMKQKYYDKYSGKITLVIGEENRVYQIFSVYEAPSDDIYTNTKFLDFSGTINMFKERSVISFNKDLSKAKEILTLSTCHDNNKDRLVVQAYRVQ